MTSIDALNIGVSVGLGLLSLGVSGFAVWLSFQFNDRSKEALNTVQELTREIKTSVEVGLSQQQDMSDKMLDSILEDEYGTERSDGNSGVDDIMNTVEKKIKEAEERMVSKVKSDLEEGGKSQEEESKRLKEVMENLKKEIEKEFEVKSRVKNEVSKYIDEWSYYPAQLLVTAAVVETEANSISDIEKVADEYNLPGEWRRGLDNLLNSSLMSGSYEEFNLRPGVKKEMEEWFLVNSDIINQIKELYGGLPDEEARELSRDLVEDIMVRP